MPRLARHPLRILIVRLSSLGDIVHTLPALEALRQLQPRAWIGWIVETPGNELLVGHPAVDEVISLPRKAWWRQFATPGGTVRAIARALSGARSLSRRQFDVAMDFQGNFRSGLVTLASGAPVRVGFARRQSRELNRLFTNVRIEASPGEHRADRALELVRFFGEIPAGIAARIPHSLAAEIGVARWFKSWPEARFTVVMHPGTSPFGVFKRWPSSRFGELASRLIRDLEARVVVSWGPDEEHLAVDVWEASNREVILAPPPRNLADFVALVRSCDLFVGADTGPTHIAAAAGVPTVAIFGPKDPAVYAPRFKSGAVVRAPVPCSPCRRRTCDKPECMDKITVDMVYDAVIRCLTIDVITPR